MGSNDKRGWGELPGSPCEKLSMAFILSARSSHQRVQNTKVTSSRLLSRNRRSAVGWCSELGKSVKDTK